MGEAQVKFGDKIFLYGQFLRDLNEFDNYDYNAVMGYMTVGGYLVNPIESDTEIASIPGFVVDFLSQPSLAVETPFLYGEMIDVTEKLALSLPLPVGTRVWMPTTQ